MSNGSQNQQTYEVQAILGSRKKSNGEKLYLIKWKGYSSADNTWEPVQHLVAVQEMIREYQLKQFQLAMENISKKIYKSEKIKRRFQASKKKILQKKMLQTFKLQEFALGNKKYKQAKRTNFPLKKRVIDKQSKRVDQKQAQIEQKVQPTKNVMQEQIEPKATSSKNQQIQQLSKTTELKQTLQTGYSTKLRGKMLYSRFLKKQMEAQECQKQQSEQIEQEQSQEQEIQDIIRGLKKVELATITHEKGTFYFHIPFKSEGQAKQLKISQQQVFKINPEWLNSFFLGFQF